ncbi:hypothetical protein HJC23_012690 [Cyclotella cryptica]|uniref:MI domain-containing protein n=1 Tax=Cyclotella cryptica TaxID=29204 RepID=A0ABD3PRX4_9STRA|eukprot:CCRYP_013312-RA/>CCRYP_013312-RA protein AED:0.40 eAED:0.40 QI:0/-1/0/1/-1/1/1/0/1069
MKKRQAPASGSRTKHSNNGGGIVIEASNRKARRKEQRHSKKMKKQHQHQPHTAVASVPDTKMEQAVGKKKKKSIDVLSDEKHSTKRVKFSNVVEETIIPAKQTPTIRTSLLRSKTRDNQKRQSLDNEVEDDEEKFNAMNNSTTYYYHLDDETAAALRRDDMEIEYLESNLGIHKGKGKGGNRELNKEYAKNEGYGDDFGDFLMGLDDLVERCVGQNEESDRSEEGRGASDENSDGESASSDDEDNGSEESSVEYESDEDEVEQKHEKSRETIDTDEDEHYDSEIEDADIYANLDEETALALRNDDAEIAHLEAKLGLKSGQSKQAKKKLKQEYAKTFCGYGEDFGDFLDELDSLAYRVGMGQDSRREGALRDEDSEDDNSGALSNDDDTDGCERHQDESDSEDSEDSDSALENDNNEADHDVAFTYRPTTGEDIYGNKIDSENNNTAKPTKYVPPHLRKKMGEASSNDADDTGSSVKAIKPAAVEADPETIKLIQRSLNNSLNRLSENTLESVAKSISLLYSQYPFHDMNECLWKNIRLACIPPNLIMSGLIPLYIAAMAGVHWIGGDKIQLGGCLIEWSVKQLYESLERGRSGKDVLDEEDGRGEVINKEASNALLIVCYLYNYGVVHCTLIYDLVRDMIKNFSEIDVESLLLILCHCGQQLRSDDPSALKEIVLMVRDRAQRDNESTNATDKKAADSSRVEFMLSTITDLKNNKPRKQDAAIREKTGTFKKCIGRMKSSGNHSLVKSTASCLRITLRDVLDAETQGRWWMVGASWAGNQKFLGDDDAEEVDDNADPKQGHQGKSKPAKDPEEEKLLALASSQRMNTDARRSIFCIVMGSSDCNDAFVKLARAELLKPKNERDVIRVLVHCCGEEKSFNPFYAHLIMRVCEYQPKSKFTLMLSFWDIFKQLESFSARKAANLAKLLATVLLGTNEKYLTIGVLKRIEFSPTAMPEQVVLFLSIVMSSLFESASNRALIQDIFDVGAASRPLSKSRKKKQRDVFDSDDEDEWNEQPKSSKKEDLSDLKESIATFLLQYMQSSPKNVEGSKFRENLSAAMKSCEGSHNRL